MRRGLTAIVATAIALLSAAAPASADWFVGASTPGAADSGGCTTAATPCRTITAAVAKAQAAGGGTVRVLPNPDRRTTDAYPEAVVLGAGPVTLVGAGAGVNGTEIAPSSGTPLTLGSAGDEPARCG